jgi:hypothetical protein
MSDQPASSAPDTPFAIGPQHMATRGLSRWRSTIAVLVLSGAFLAAMTGVLGGGPSQREEVAGQGMTAELLYDPIVRSGNWYETEVTLRVAADVKDLTVAIDEPLWSRLSIDTIAPDAESAEALDGRYSYHFGEVKAGERFRLKLDGQIQPGLPRRQSGAIRVLEGATDPERELLALPVNLTVLP